MMSITVYHDCIQMYISPTVALDKLFIGFLIGKMELMDSDEKMGHRINEMSILVTLLINMFNVLFYILQIPVLRQQTLIKIIVYEIHIIKILQGKI